MTITIVTNALPINQTLNRKDLLSNVGTCFIVGGIAAADSHTEAFVTLLSVGIALITLGSIFLCIGYCMIDFQRVAQMRQAIAKESIKYSSKSPIPCGWRLETSRHLPGENGNDAIEFICHLVIDIGRSIIPESRAYHSNQVAPEPTSFFQQQDNSPPPPYSDQSARFYSQCTAPR